MSALRLMFPDGGEREVVTHPPTGNPRDGSFATQWMAHLPGERDYFAMGGSALLAAAALALREGWAACEIIDAPDVPSGQTFTRTDRDAQRTRAEAAEAEVARLRAIVEGRTTPPTDAEIDAHWRAGGGWIYSRPEGVRASVVVQPMTVRSIIYAAACQRETLRWMAVDANSRPTAWPVVEAPAPDLCDCGHPVEMHRGADRCGAHGCGCDRNAEEASWR